VAAGKGRAPRCGVRLQPFSTSLGPPAKAFPLRSMLKNWRLTPLTKPKRPSAENDSGPLPGQPPRPRPRTDSFRSVRVCHEGCFRLQATRAVIYKTSPCPAPATQDPRCTGPRRSRRPHLTIRRPGVLNITASCGQRVCPVCHAHCFLKQQEPNRSARASRSRILHASPSLRFCFALLGGVASESEACSEHDSTGVVHSRRQ